MPDPTSICNQAIGELGGAFIQGFTDGTSLSNLCGQMYPGVLDEVLELHPWNFAMRFMRLPEIPSDPNEAAMEFWGHKYQLPSDYLKVRSVACATAKFRIGADRVLYSNDGSVTIEYTARVEDLGAWSPLARQVLAKIMASYLAKPLTGQNSTAQLKYQEALSLLPEARSSDSREGSPQTLRANTSLLVRRHGWGGTWGPRWNCE